MLAETTQLEKISKNEKESTLVKYEKTSSNITGSYFNAANKH